MDIDGEAAGTCAYDFALETARARGNKRAARQLEAVGPPPHLTVKQFSTRVRWASTFGGVTTHETYGSIARSLMASLLRSPDYSLGDVVRTLRGVSATQGALLSELAAMDLMHSPPVIDVPVVMAQGRLDQVAPGEAAQRYFDQLNAPSKQLVWFEHSAHTPQLEEPQLFRSLMLQVRADEFASN
jgi:pimeloyl-ACP methyl ester carboxylesterase